MRLYLLLLGEACIDKGAVVSPGIDDGKRMHMPVPGYLVQTDDGHNILIDTGMHRRHIDDPDYTFRGKEIAKVLQPVMRREDSMIRRLAALDLSPQDIDYVINTHLHFDHCGNNDLFKDATIFVQREHYEMAKGHENFPNEYFDLPSLKYELIDGEPELFPGIKMILTPGHAPWHQSILINLKHDGHILLCSDAVYCQDNIDHDNWGAQMEPEVARESYKKLQKIADDKDALMVYGHDVDQWRTLRHAPEYYT